MPYREGYWSEGETSSLVNALGDRYIELNSGNLRQKQWKEVADAINSRRGAGRRPSCTDVQCKNRIDTLKKKYKVEMSRVAGSGESQWPFLSRLDALVGSAPPPTLKKQSGSPLLALVLPFHQRGSALPVASSAVDNPFFRCVVAAVAAATTEGNDDIDEDEVIAKMVLSEPALPADRHLERTLKASFKAFEEEELPKLKKEKPDLTFNQYRDMLWKFWKRSPDNPLNQNVLLDLTTLVFEAMKVRDVFSWSSMVDGYCKYGRVCNARELFDTMPVNNTVSHVAEVRANALHKVDISSLHSQLGSLAAILLCIGVSATSAKSVDMCKLLLGQARSGLSEIFHGSSPKLGPSYWEQVQEAATISVTRHILQLLYDLLEQEKSLILQEIRSEGRMIFSVNEPSKKGQRQRAIDILHQMIDDTHQGKVQFLSGKLHNLSKAIAVEETENNYNNEEGSYSIKMACSNKGTIVGLGLRAPKLSTLNPSSTESIPEITYELKDTGKRFFGPVISKPSTYLSSFIIYIATLGDIVDGVDTTHDFNFFHSYTSRPKILLVGALMLLER